MADFGYDRDLEWPRMIVAIVLRDAEYGKQTQQNDLFLWNPIYVLDPKSCQSSWRTEAHSTCLSCCCHLYCIAASK